MIKNKIKLSTTIQYSKKLNIRAVYSNVINNNIKARNSNIIIIIIVYQTFYYLPRTA